MTAPHAIPFAISVKRLFRTDFVFEHEVEFGVARAKVVARIVVASSMYDEPRIVERQSKGGIELTDKLIDQLGLLCFEVLATQLRGSAGDSGWWVWDDIAPRIRNHFDPRDCDLVLQALDGHVQPGVQVMNLCAIEGDDPL